MLGGGLKLKHYSFKGFEIVDALKRLNAVQFKNRNQSIGARAVERSLQTLQSTLCRTHVVQNFPCCGRIVDFSRTPYLSDVAQEPSVQASAKRRSK